MRLSDIFSPSPRPVKGEKSASLRSGGSSSDNINRQIKALTPGKVIQGEVLDKNGGEVRIKLSDDMVLTARLDKDVNVEAGRLLAFEVRNNGSFLSLSPLFTNTANTDTVLKALQMAGLPVNSDTVAMTDAMMQQGMSIDSKSLQSMFKEVVAFSQTDPVNIVTLHQLGLEVNEENIQQLENYQNLRYQLLEGITDVLSELPGALQQAVAAGGEEGGVKMYQALLGLFLTESAGEGEEGEVSENLTEGTVSPGKGEQVLQEAGVQAPAAGQEAGNTQEAVSLAAFAEGENAMQEALAGLTAGEDISAESRLPLNPEERNTLAALLEELPKESLPDKENFLMALRQGSLDTREVLTALSHVQGGEAAEKALVELLKSPEFGKLFREQVLEQWALKPDEVMKENKVEELYDKLQKQLDNMKEILQNAGAGQTAAAKNAGNVSQNLDFMNQMNHLYTYVQLPLKMAGGQTTGDLYVYTNKRSLAERDGNVSALLHLDMENLGPVDVYIAMQQERVSTRFTVRDDDMLDFLNDNMHILNERLEKKGYSMHCEMSVREEAAKESPIAHILNGDRNNTVLAQYGFDVRT